MVSLLNWKTLVSSIKTDDNFRERAGMKGNLKKKINIVMYIVTVWHLYSFTAYFFWSIDESTLWTVTISMSVRLKTILQLWQFSDILFVVWWIIAIATVWREERRFTSSWQDKIVSHKYRTDRPNPQTCVKIYFSSNSGTASRPSPKLIPVAYTNGKPNMNTSTADLNWKLTF